MLSAMSVDRTTADISAWFGGWVGECVWMCVSNTPAWLLSAHGSGSPWAPCPLEMAYVAAEGTYVPCRHCWLWSLARGEPGHRSTDVTIQSQAHFYLSLSSLASQAMGASPRPARHPGQGMWRFTMCSGQLVLHIHLCISGSLENLYLVSSCLSLQWKMWGFTIQCKGSWGRRQGKQMAGTFVTVL